MLHLNRTKCFWTIFLFCSARLLMRREKWSLTVFNCILYAFQCIFHSFNIICASTHKSTRSLYLWRKKISSNISKHSFCIIATYSYIIQVKMERIIKAKEATREKKIQTFKILQIHYLTADWVYFLFYKYGLFLTQRMFIKTFSFFLSKFLCAYLSKAYATCLTCSAFFLFVCDQTRRYHFVGNKIQTLGMP